MTKERCDYCDDLVKMLRTPQTLRKYCPECFVVQSERETPHADMQVA